MKISDSCELFKFWTDTKRGECWCLQTQREWRLFRVTPSGLIRWTDDKGAGRHPVLAYDDAMRARAFARRAEEKEGSDGE